MPKFELLCKIEAVVPGSLIPNVVGDVQGTVAGEHADVFGDQVGGAVPVSGRSAQSALFRKRIFGAHARGKKPTETAVPIGPCAEHQHQVGDAPVQIGSAIRVLEHGPGHGFGAAQVGVVHAFVDAVVLKRRCHEQLVVGVADDGLVKRLPVHRTLGGAVHVSAVEGVAAVPGGGEHVAPLVVLFAKQAFFPEFAPCFYPVILLINGKLLRNAFNGVNLSARAVVGQGLHIELSAQAIAFVKHAVQAVELPAAGHVVEVVVVHVAPVFYNRCVGEQPVREVSLALAVEVHVEFAAAFGAGEGVDEHGFVGLWFNEFGVDLSRNARIAVLYRTGPLGQLNTAQPATRDHFKRKRRGNAAECGPVFE